MLNVIAIMGRVVADPELRKTPSGVSATRFTVACDRNYCKPGEQRQCDFLDVVAWRGTAEFVCKYFKKGQLMALDGSLQTHSYEDKDGNKRKAYEIVAGNVNFAESKKLQAEQAQPDESALSAAGPEEFSVVDESEDLPF